MKQSVVLAVTALAGVSASAISLAMSRLQAVVAEGMELYILLPLSQGLLLELQAGIGVVLFLAAWASVPAVGKRLQFRFVPTVLAWV